MGKERIILEACKTTYRPDKRCKLGYRIMHVKVKENWGSKAAANLRSKEYAKLGYNVLTYYDNCR